MHLNEKSGGNDKNVGIISYFREATFECNLVDVGCKGVGCKGHPFTWSNRQFGPHNIEKRLDRALCSKDWGYFFLDEVVTNMLM